MHSHRDTDDEAAEDLGGMTAANENGSEEAGEAFESLTSIVSRLVGRLRAEE